MCSEARDLPNQCGTDLLNRLQFFEKAAQIRLLDGVSCARCVLDRNVFVRELFRALTGRAAVFATALHQSFLDFAGTPAGAGHRESRKQTAWACRCRISISAWDMLTSENGRLSGVSIWGS